MTYPTLAMSYLSSPSILLREILFLVGEHLCPIASISALFIGMELPAGVSTNDEDYA